MALRRSQILGIGSHAPSRVVTNEELGVLLGVSGDWIHERTGIRERRWVNEGTGSSDLAVPASLRALEAAGLDVGQIGMIVFATLSPDHDFPGTGVFLQRKLGLGPMPVLDIRQQCTGFLYGLAIADQFVRTGAIEYVLVVGAEVHSTGLDLSPRGRDVSVLFGDGAGAAVVGPAREEGRGILATRLYADGASAEDLWVEVPSSRKRPRLTAQDVEAGRHFPVMRGKQVFRNAVTRMPELVLESLGSQGFGLADLGCLIPHQANLRISENVKETLGLPEGRMHNNIERYGNTTAASIPLCMDEAIRLGKIVPGDLVCLVAFGAGYTWASCLLRW
jgi:3-oxoacyl-[acyl-carrier-protein] synthase III